MTDYERGFAAGVEAAASYLNGWHGYTISVATVANIRALSPAEPTGREPDDGTSMDCSCGLVTLDWFTREHSQLTKDGEQFISTNHRRDRCDREIVTPDPIRDECGYCERGLGHEGYPCPQPPREESRERYPTGWECAECGGKGHLGIGIHGLCPSCGGTGSARGASPKGT